MPDINALRLRMNVALRDGKVDSSEAKSLIDAANQGGLTVEAKNELKGQFERNRDRFDPAASALINSFLLGGTPTPTPGPVTTTRTDLPDPAVLNKHAGTTYAWNDSGQLFVNGVELDDVLQGQIANCYMVGAFAAIAQREPDTIKNAIKDNGDGTYTVRFYERSYGAPPKEVLITVDGQLPAGGTKYGKGRDKNELWVGVMEKAYAQWKGGYEAIGNGGYSGQVMAAITGRPESYIGITSYTNTDTLFSQIKANFEAGKLMTAGTHGEDQSSLYSGSGLYAWHVYTVTGTVEENGEKFVLLRNPWGSSEPGSDGTNDGSFKLPLADFAKYYAGVNVS